jgi:two-component system response regulator LytT
LQVMLVDDEWCVLEELAYRLEGKANIVGKLTNPLEAVEKVSTLAPDAVFLDIEMPGLNGLETAAEILKLKPETAIIFVTAYSHHAVQAFELNAIDYLVKPVQPKRLEMTLERLEKRLIEDKQPAAGSDLIHLLQSSVPAQQPSTILLWKGKHCEIKALDTVAGCFVAKGERVVSVLADGQIYHTTGSLHDFVSKIEATLLVRCHRSYYINPHWLIRLERTQERNHNAYLDGYSEPIPVSRAYRQSLLEIIHNNQKHRGINSCR